jgi:hypothetical protein
MVDVSRLGAINDGATKDALFLQVFSGEVLAQFLETNKFMDKHTVRTIQSGKSASFPCMGTASVKYHTPGDSVLSAANYLSKVNHNERVISIDDILTSSVLIADADELQNHYDVRSHYSTAIGHALAKKMDENVLSTIFAASKEDTPNVTGGKVGGSLTVADTGTGLIDFAFDAAQKLDENDAPKEGRFLAVRPAQYYKLIQDAGSATSLVNRDFDGNADGMTSGVVFKLAGMTIVSTNNMRSDDDDTTTTAGEKNDVHDGGGIGYNSDFSKLKALAFTPDCVGTVKLADLSMESEYQVDRLATLFMAKYMCGHGILRPECAVSAVIA